MLANDPVLIQRPVSRPVFGGQSTSSLSRKSSAEDKIYSTKLRKPPVSNSPRLFRQSSIEGADPSVTDVFGPEQRLDMTITERPRLFLTSIDDLDSSVISQPDTARAVGTVLPCADDMLCLLESQDDDISRAGSLVSARQLSIPRSSLELEAGQPSGRSTPESEASAPTPSLSRAPSDAPRCEMLSSRSACAAVLAHVDLLVTRLQATERKGGGAQPPHCVEGGPETLRIIRKILEQFPYTATPNRTRGRPSDGRVRMKAVTDDMARLYVPLALLRLLRVNLDWMAKGGGERKMAPSATTESLLATLLGLVEQKPESGGAERMLHVQALAVDALRSGLPIFLPEVRLLTSLGSRSSNKMPFRALCAGLLSTSALSRTFRLPLVCNVPRFEQDCLLQHNGYWD
jgi:hypothetical protein